MPGYSICPIKLEILEAADRLSEMKPRDWRPLSLVTQLGLTVVTALVGCLLIGLWLDGLLGTRPLLTLVFSLLGVLIGTVGVYRLVARAIAEAAASLPPPKAGPRSESAEPDAWDDEEKSENDAWEDDPARDDQDDWDRDPWPNEDLGEKRGSRQDELDQEPRRQPRVDDGKPGLGSEDASDTGDHPKAP